MPKRKNLEVLVDIIITHQDTQLEEKKVVQVYLLSESIRGVLEWMNYKGR
jgi:hypothetical protein